MSTMTDSGSGKQIAALDGVRGLAILLVLLIHLQQTGVIPARLHFINLMMHAGWCGVDLFFVLSGFLITLGLLDSKESVNYFSAFYMRRVLRIFPLYYAVLIAAIVASMVFADWSPKVTLLSDGQNGPLFPGWLGWISHVFYFQNWWMPWKEPASQNILGHFWSLGVEEQFYLVWPLCIWLIPRKRLPVLCLAFCAVVPILRIYLAGYSNLPPHIIFMNTFTRADTLIAGALCALVVRDYTLQIRVRRWLPALAVLGVSYMAVIAFFVRDSSAQLYYTQTLGFTALALTFGALVLWAYWLSGSRGWFDRLFSMRPLTNLGKYSYGLYVYHVPVIILAKIWFGARPWFGHEILPGLFFCVGAVLAGVCVAVVSYELFEKRFLRLKRYFKPCYGNSPEPDASSSPLGTAIQVI